MMTTAAGTPAINTATISTTRGSTAMTVSTSHGAAAIASVLSRMRFPEPSTYWSIPGDQANF